MNPTVLKLELVASLSGFVFMLLILELRLIRVESPSRRALRKRISGITNIKTQFTD